jgi:MoaA/NifB/PqqE/SkfB family radical SAM enzyme
VISVLARLPLFRVGRAIGRPLTLPASLTVSVLYACNSRCLSCRIYETKADVLDLSEYHRIFRSLGRAPRWVTISGGEPFLRKDLPAVVGALHQHCRPSVINLPTNASMPDRVEAYVDEIAATARDSSIIVNVSLDHIGVAHDRLRGLENNYARAERSIEALRRIKQKRANVTFGIHTVISRRNEDDFPRIADALARFEPDSYIAEVAERRVELGTESDEDLTPTPEGVHRALAHLRLQADLRTRTRRARAIVELLVAGLRREYYRILDDWVDAPREVLPCYAAVTSAHIMPEGKVWACCVLGETLGELRAVDYDFPTVWYSAAAASIRARIKRERCHCPLANQSYMNVLVDPRSLVRASARAGEVAARSLWHASS